VRKASDWATDAGSWSVYAVQTGDGSSATVDVYGVNVIEGQPYLVKASTTDESLLPLMVEFVFVPALQAFEVAP
jgi:hypothetical protein